jgi:hypothetical protein
VRDGIQDGSGRAYMSKTLQNSSKKSSVVMVHETTSSGARDRVSADLMVLGFSLTSEMNHTYTTIQQFAPSSWGRPVKIRRLNTSKHLYLALSLFLSMK